MDGLGPGWGKVAGRAWASLPARERIERQAGWVRSIYREPAARRIITPATLPPHHAWVPPAGPCYPQASKARKAGKQAAPLRGSGAMEVEAVARDLSALTDDARVAALMADAPELVSLLQDLKDSLAEVRWGRCAGVRWGALGCGVLPWGVHFPGVRCGALGCAAVLYRLQRQHAVGLAWNK